MAFVRKFGICTVFAFATSVALAADTRVTSKQYVDNQLSMKLNTTLSGQANKVLTTDASGNIVTTMNVSDIGSGGGQPLSNAAYQMGNTNGTWQTMSASQQNALNSGATAAKVSGYDTHVADTAIHVTTTDKANWNAKQAALSETQLTAVNSGATTTNIGQIATNTANIATNTADIAGKQPKSTAAAIGGANGTWTNLTELQQNALNAMIPAGSPTAPTGYVKIWVQ